MVARQGSSRLICVNLRNLRIFYLRHVMSLSAGSKSATTEKSRKFGADSHDKYGITAQANALSLWIGGQRRERNRGCSAWLPSPYRSVEELRMIHRINSAVIGLLASIVVDLGRRLHADSRRAQPRPLVLPDSAVAVFPETRRRCVHRPPALQACGHLGTADARCPGNRVGSALGRRGDAGLGDGSTGPRRHPLAARNRRGTMSASSSSRWPTSSIRPASCRWSALCRCITRSSSASSTTRKVTHVGWPVPYTTDRRGVPGGGLHRPHPPPHGGGSGLRSREQLLRSQGIGD